jgi:hypothetical protein
MKHFCHGELFERKSSMGIHEIRETCDGEEIFSLDSCQNVKLNHFSLMVAAHWDAGGERDFNARRGARCVKSSVEGF